MKFVCVTCDEPMKLVHTAPPDRGSITALFRCPKCAQQTAMLTNPFETQMVRSLGVEIRPSNKEGGEERESGCPFSGMLSGIEQDESKQSADVPWTTEARGRLDRMPEFIRPMAESGIERFALERGYSEIDVAVLDEAKSFFGM